MEFKQAISADASPEVQQLLAIKERLAKAGKGKGKAAGASAATAGAVLDTSPLEAYTLALSVLANASISSSGTNSRISPSVLALETLELLLKAALTLAKSDPGATTLHELYTPSFLLLLSDAIYAALDSGYSTALKNSRACVQTLLALAKLLGAKAVPEHLRSRVVVAPWFTKRSIIVFHSLLASMEVEELRELAVLNGGESVATGVLRKLTEGMLVSDDVATLSGKVAMDLVEKTWAEGKESEGFWIVPAVEACRGEEKGRNNVCLHLLVALFRKRPTAFRQLLEAGGFLNEVEGKAWEERDLEAALGILKAGNTLGLIDLSEDKTAPTTKVRLPSSLLLTCLHHANGSLRCSALALLVLSPSLSTLFPSSTFPLLTTFYTQSMGEEDAEFRMQSIALSGKLLLRLRDSSWRAHRLGDTAYLASAQSFILSWFSSLLASLNPAKPFRIRINALRLLDLLFQAHLDPTFRDHSSCDAVGYSSYRRTAPTAAPQFQAKHRSAGSGIAEHLYPAGWPYEIRLVTPEATFTLLRLLLSTYTALRSLAITLLERFPTPLPGYEGIEGGEKAKRELLGPALRMVRSGREAESSAGAGIVGLVWRKWGLEGEGDWRLGEIGGWKVGSGEGAFSFLSDLMDLADIQLTTYEADLARAASTTPMHGTLLALRHLFVSIPSSSISTLTSLETRRALFARALAIVERVWEVTRVVLATSAPEGATEVTDTEEARALRFEGPQEDAEMDGGDAEGNGGPMHKIILSATWRAMKEAAELLETILRLPSELGAEAFQSIWTLDDVKHMGDLFAIWLARIRHRGAFMAIHPCYSRACTALIRCKDWPEVEKLPVEWLDVHLDSIVSQKISITRRSAGIPYCILGILIVILPTNRAAFDRGLARLFDIAESTSADILDESRVHAMNTLRTAFLEAKISTALAPYIERGFLVSISMFWSPNWICRNAAMMFYASLITRSFGFRRTNLERNNAGLVERLSIGDFFGRYPSLHPVLLKELEFASREHLHDLPTSDVNSSSLFSILMLLSLVQTSNRIDGAMDSVADPFLPFVLACAKSRVWKIRDAAGDALTGLVSPAEVATTALSLLAGVENCVENELHGRLVQASCLLEASAPLAANEQLSITTRFDAFLPTLLASNHSFAVRTTFLNIACVVTRTTPHRSVPLLNAAHAALDASRSWPQTTSHLPSAENFVTAAFNLALLYDPTDSTLLVAGLAAPFLEIQRAALAHLQEQGSVEGVVESLLALANGSKEAAECRISAIEVLTECEWTEDPRVGELLEGFTKVRGETVIVPLREALLPLLARLADAAGDATGLEAVLLLADAASRGDESIESRESASRALCELHSPAVVRTERFSRLLLRLLQDDDTTVRDVATTVATRVWTGGMLTTERRVIEAILASAGPASWLVCEDELRADLNLLSNPSSLLFAIEKPNIFVDDLLETELLVPSTLTASDSVATVEATLNALASALTASAPGPVDLEGPLGLIGNDLVCKWAFRLVARVDMLRKEGVEVGQGELVEKLRRSFLAV